MEAICLTHHRTAKTIITQLFELYSNSKELLYNRACQYLQDDKNTKSIFLLVTCHRCELYFSRYNLTNDSDLLEIVQYIFGKVFLENISNNYTDYYKGKKTIKHLLAVSVGIDSKIIGEVDILDQVKRSLLDARRHGLVDNEFINMMSYIVEKSKHFREAYLDHIGLVSYASIPSRIVNEKGGGNNQILLIGTGMLGVRILEKICATHPEKIYVSGRDTKKLKSIANNYNIKETITINDILNVISSVTIIICCVSGGEILDINAFEHIKNNRVTVIDFGVPANACPEIIHHRQIDYFTFDDFNQIIETDLYAKKNIKVLLKQKINNEVNILFDKI